jgi:hypothetical protein
MIGFPDRPDIRSTSNSFSRLPVESVRQREAEDGSGERQEGRRELGAEENEGNLLVVDVRDTRCRGDVPTFDSSSPIGR